MNKEKIEKLIIKVGKVIDLARKISGKIFFILRICVWHKIMNAQRTAREWRLLWQM